MKKIAILGSTGSIGTQTLDVVRANGDIEVLGISAGRNIRKAGRTGSGVFIHVLLLYGMKTQRKILQIRLKIQIQKLFPEWMGFLELAAMPETEILVTAIVGMLGIRPTIEAIRAGKDIALANKETLGDSRSSDHADGKRIWCADSSCGQ